MTRILERAPAAEAEPENLPDNAAVAAAIEFLVDRYPERPSLDEVAAVAGLHPHHFQRVFKRWAGISPKRFIQHLTIEHAKHLLDGRESVLSAALETGLSGPGRLHDLFIACEAMSPGEYKARGRDLVIRWGLHETPLGRVLVGITDRGICWFSFETHRDGHPAIDEFRREWAEACLVEDVAATAPVARRALAPQGDGPVPLLLRGTNFQIKVWQALLAIPSGTIATYEDIARAIGRPRAVRAVGQAVGRNPVSLIIPCHRVIRKSGAIHSYRWGADRKRAILAWEAAQREAAE
ncbi:MAG TPA: methylated-DNA--[protein]-cysteine S-methyltransferase [Alphaproteobacteria bacterium]|nr:methylated-DNA--[protein]-cysteine S-methyltransferase [Alphaproteobacteria bacterium]